MNKPTMKQLTKSLIESILPQEIIYAEISAPGAMGNSGGIIMYLIVDGTLICFKTNLFTDDEEIYEQAEELILKHQDQIEHTDLELQEKLFDNFWGGMGNQVFVNSKIKLEIADGYFIYKKDNIEYQILTSVKGVFNCVIYNMTNPDSDEA